MEERRGAMAETIELTITGMTCDHCVRAVTEAIAATPGVTAAEVDLAGGSAMVTGEGLDPEALVAAIGEEGYGAALQPRP